MIDLVLDILLLDDKRLRRRMTGLVASLILPVLLAILTLAWATVAMYAALTLHFGSLEAALLLVLILLVLTLLAFVLLMRRRARHRPENFVDGLISALAGRRADGDRQANDDIAALILLLATQLQSGNRK